MASLGPQTLRLRLPLKGAEAFVQAWAGKLERGCLLLPTRREWPPGTLVRFELQDLDGERLLLGEGKVSEHLPRKEGSGLLLRVARMDAISKERWRQIGLLAREEGSAGLESGVALASGDSSTTDPAGQTPEAPDELDAALMQAAPADAPTSPGESRDHLDAELEEEGDDEATAVARPGEAGGPDAADPTAGPPTRDAREVLLFGEDLEEGPRDEATQVERGARQPELLHGDGDQRTAAARPSSLQSTQGEAEPPESTDSRLRPLEEDDEAFEQERTESITAPVPKPKKRKKKPAVPWQTDSQRLPDAAALESGRSATLAGVFSSDEVDLESPILGIDLGTCRVLAAIADERGVRCLPLDKAGRGLPAVIASGKGGQVLVGASALARRLEQPGETVFGSKRLLGKRYHAPAVQALAESFPFELVPDEAGGVAVNLAAHTLTAVEINARILGAVKAGAELALGRSAHQAVISVPAYFGDAGRAAVRQAGLEAGLEVLKIVSEPTAAALAFGYGQKIPGRRVLVFDLGGGTFDVSVLTISGDRFEVVGTGGDNFLGGLDFDLEIVRALLEVMIRQGGPEWPEPTTLERLLAEAEKVKITLTTAKSAQLKIDDLWQDGEGSWHDLMVEVSREELEAWVAPLVDRTIALTEAILKDHALSADQLDDLILVGAQSRMPLIRERLESRLGIEPRDGVDPEQAVALGCALVARDIQQAADPRAAKMELQDILGQNIGLGLPDGRIAPVIERGTKIPCKRTVRVATSEVDQTSIELSLFQGNVRYTEAAEYLGTLSFIDLPVAPPGEIQLVVVFSLDGEGLLTVKATNEATGKAVSRLLSTVETPEEVQAGIRRSNTLIRDLANLVPSGERGGRESSGIMRGIRRLFGGDA